MCSLRDAAGEFERLEADLFAVSLDDVQSLREFAEAQSLGFTLLSDPDGSVARKFGVLSERGWAERVTFVAAPNGELRHIERKVDVGKHGADLAELLRKLRAQ